MKLLFNPVFYSFFDGGLGGVVPPPVVGITAPTITPIIIPMAVKILTIVMPCSLNNVLVFPESGVFFQDLFIQSNLDIRSVQGPPDFLRIIGSSNFRIGSFRKCSVVFVRF